MSMILLVLIVVPFSAMSQEETREDYLKAFDKRVETFITRYDTSSRANYNSIAAKYYRNSDVKEADEMFIKLLENPRGAMFWMYPVIGAYMVGKEVMSTEAKAALRNAWKTYAPSRGDTENHWAMYYACLLIAAEQWPDLPGSEWYNGRSSEENFIESKEYLFEWARITTTIGQGEFDSPDYLNMYFTASTHLAEWALDPEVKKLGAMLADYFLADFAVEHLDQQYCGGHSRIYERNLMRFQSSSSSTIAYLYFGVGEPLYSGAIFFPALTSYRLPEVIRKIATDRSVPYVHKEKKRVRHNIRFGEEKNPPVYKYTYMTKDYALGSLHGDLLQPIQQQTWSVRYLYGQPFSTIFGLHPFWSIYEIGTYFPEEIKPSMAGITASKTTYNNPDKWTGGSFHERTFQHRNTMIALYDIPVGSTTEHIDGFFPANLEERMIDESGWIVCKAGDTYVGWYPLQPGFWSEEYEARNQRFNTGTSARVNDGTMTLRNFRFRSHELQNGYVIEVRSKDEIGSFERFHSKLKLRKPAAVLEPGNVSVEYITIDNDKMDFKYPDARTLNGGMIDLEKYKLFEGPYLNAEVGSQMLTLTHGDLKMVLDFEKLEKKETY
jgi:hypothetical protein